MSARWQQIRSMAAALRAQYAAELGAPVSFPLAVADLAERVLLLTAFPDPELDPRIQGELNPAIQSIRLRPGLDPARERFVVGHELGHYVVEGAAALFEDDDTTLDERAGGDGETEGGVLRAYNTRERQEQEANLFALELLVPADVLWQRVQRPSWTTAGLAGEFGVSEDALRTQLLNACCLEPVVAAAPAGAGSPSSFAPDPEQQAAVAAPLPTLVIAGPGTGKTRSIVAKYASLVDSGVDPAAILALTFSNKAAEEMRARIIRALRDTRPDVAGRVEVSTFHAWGLNFLKSYGHTVGLPLAVQLRASGDLFILLKRHLARLPLAQYKALHDPGQNLGAIMGAISRAKDELCGPEEYCALAEAEAARLEQIAAAAPVGKETVRARDERERAGRNAARLRELAAVYARYEALLRAEGVLDYGDLIMQSVAALRHPAVAADLHARYSHILVDEFQDINYASGQLVALLDGGRGVVWAVGDPWQSIYRFRGASAANLADFPRLYPAATIAPLARNYRSLQPILDAAFAVMQSDPLAPSRGVQPAQRRVDKRMVRVAEWVADDAAAEAAAIAHDIARRVGGRRGMLRSCGRRGGVRRVPHRAAMPAPRRPRLRDHVVLCRTHAQVARIVTALEAHGVPVDGGGSLLAYPEAKDVLAVCGLARSANSAGLLRALTLPEHALSPADFATLVQLAHAQRRSLPRATRDDAIVEQLSAAGQQALATLHGLRADLAQEGDAWRVVTRYLFGHSALLRERICRAAQGDAAARRELANIGQVTLLARNFVRQAPHRERGANHFIAYVRLLIEAGEAPRAAPLPDSADVVRVMTIHAAKGLEFRAVYVPGLSEGQFPPRKQGSTVPEVPGLVHGPLGDERDEERYLLYVALTRAQDRLILSRARRKGDKTLERSSLLPGGAAGAESPWPRRRIRLKPPCRPPQTATRLRAAPIARPTVAATSVDTYEKCPRRYLYQYGYQLFDDAAPFLRMHQTIRDSIKDLIEQAQAGALPPDEPALRSRVWEIFARHELEGVLYQDDYFAEAFAHVRQVWSSLGADQGAAGAVNREIVVQRPAGAVTVRVDRVEQTPAGERFVQLKSGKRGTDDHRSTRIMLYALAAEQCAADIAIHYTALDETHGATPKPDLLQRHTARIDELLDGIMQGRWEQKPGPHCDTCPFNLICPV